jgi:hypothetical protein
MTKVSWRSLMNYIRPFVTVLETLICSDFQNQN